MRSLLFCARPGAGSVPPVTPVTPVTGTLRSELAREKLEHIENIQKTAMRTSSPLQHINSIIDAQEIDYSKQMQTSVRQPPKLGKNRTQAFVSPSQDESIPDAVHKDMLETSIRPIPSKENAFSAIYSEFSEQQSTNSSQRTQHGVSNFLRSNKKEINAFQLHHICTSINLQTSEDFAANHVSG